MLTRHSRYRLRHMSLSCSSELIFYLNFQIKWKNSFAFMYTCIFSYCSLIMYSFHCFIWNIFFPFLEFPFTADCFQFKVLLNFCSALLLGHEKKCFSRHFWGVNKNDQNLGRKKERKNHTRRYNPHMFQLGD